MASAPGVATSNTPVGGTFRLICGDEVSDPLPSDASPADVQDVMDEVRVRARAKRRDVHPRDFE
jgi:hypothetical protein